MTSEATPARAVGGPYLTSATFCERVLEEKDGVNSLIRMADRYELRGEPAPPDRTGAIQTFFVVTIKSGDFAGEALLSVRLISPSGADAVDAVRTPITLKGAEHGVNVRILLTVPVRETGLFWADVELDGRLLTRTPLRIEYRPPSPEPAATGQ